MSSISLTKVGFVIGNFVRGFFHGSVDEALNTFTDAEIRRFKDSEDLLLNCEPWENHLKEALPKKIIA